ncbi:hypothetical protein [Algoriphagus machipongonensis]|uniref:Uncharacterized protein n=1 Tax=Algoriphagus machipongonensis TaxID=388413 RepID=A3I010_9BACT|nr:hypothetical protein [Algoriphagus machipongonensis]EAZ80846.1 hypothetical protein ALPR1_07970 [Algoriphagus machipongonensis]
MEKKEIDRFLALNEPLSSFSPELKALYFDGKGDWDTSHDQVDQLAGETAARVHAYLHRKEGDQWNADYWYRRASEKRPNLSLDEEWEMLLERFWEDF